MPAVHSTPVRAPSSSSSPDSSGVPAWAWAALGGTVVLGGVALYVLYGGSDKVRKVPKKSPKKRNQKEEGDSSGKVRMEDLPREDEEELVRMNAVLGEKSPILYAIKPTLGNYHIKLEILSISP